MRTLLPCVLLVLASCGKTQHEQEQTRQTAAQIRFMLSQSDPDAVAVGVKYNLGADTVLYIVNEYAQHHDASLVLDLKINKITDVISGSVDSDGVKMTLRPENLITDDTIVRPVRQTLRELSNKFRLSPALIGSVVFDYKLISSRSVKSGTEQ